MVEDGRGGNSEAFLREKKGGGLGWGHGQKGAGGGWGWGAAYQRGDVDVVHSSLFPLAFTLQKKFALPWELRN